MPVLHALAVLNSGLGQLERQQQYLDLATASLASSAAARAEGAGAQERVTSQTGKIRLSSMLFHQTLLA